MTIHRYFTAAATLSVLILLGFSYSKISKAPDLTVEAISNNFYFDHPQNIASSSADFALPYGDEIIDQKAINKNKINTVKYDKSLFNVTGTVVGEARYESAMISYNGNKTKLYKAGDELFDGLVLQKIDKSKVVLENQINEENFSIYITYQDSSSNSPMMEWSEKRKFKHPQAPSSMLNQYDNDKAISSLKVKPRRKAYLNPEKYFLDSGSLKKTDGIRNANQDDEYRLTPSQHTYFIHPL